MTKPLEFHEIAALRDSSPSNLFFHASYNFRRSSNDVDISIRDHSFERVHVTLYSRGMTL